MLQIYLFPIHFPAAAAHYIQSFRWSAKRTLTQVTSLHILMEGIGELRARREFDESASAMLYSGYFFDIAILNAFGVYIGLERAPILCASQPYSTCAQE